MPFILRGPGVPAGRTVRGQVSNIDFAPTLVDAAGAKAGPHDGRRLAAARRSRNPRSAPEPGDRASRRSRRCSRATSRSQRRGTGPTSGVRTDRYTYVVYNGDAASRSSTTAARTRTSCATSPPTRPTRRSRRGWPRELRASSTRCRGARAASRREGRACAPSGGRAALASSPSRGRGAGGDAPRRRRPPRRALLRDHRAQGRAADGDGHRLEHDRPEPLPGRVVERASTPATLAKELGATARRPQRPAPLPHGLGERPRPAACASFHGQRLTQGRDDPDPHRRRPGPDALHRPHDRAHATPGAGSAGARSSSSSRPAATST